MSNDVAIRTKLKGMRQKMVSKASLDEWTRTQSITQFYNHLLQYESYHKAAANIKLSIETREDLERLIELGFFEDFLKLYRFVNLDFRHFLNYYIMTFEAHVIKRVFKNITEFHESRLVLDDFGHFLEDKRHINVSELLMATTLDQAIACFSESIYAPFFEANRDLFQKEDYAHFAFEVALDQYVTKVFWRKAQKKFTPKESADFKKFYGTEIDIININTIYRLKFFYEADEHLIENALIPEYFRLNANVRNQLFFAANAREFIEIIHAIGYADVYGDTFEIEAIQSMQAAYLARLRRNLAKQHHTTLFEVINYLDDKFDERATLIQAIERMAYAKYSTIERSFS